MIADKMSFEQIVNALKSKQVSKEMHGEFFPSSSSCVSKVQKLFTYLQPDMDAQFLGFLIMQLIDACASVAFQQVIGPENDCTVDKLQDLFNLDIISSSMIKNDEFHNQIYDAFRLLSLLNFAVFKAVYYGDDQKFDIDTEIEKIMNAIMKFKFSDSLIDDTVKSHAMSLVKTLFEHNQAGTPTSYSKFLTCLLDNRLIDLEQIQNYASEIFSSSDTSANNTSKKLFILYMLDKALASMELRGHKSFNQLSKVRGAVHAMYEILAFAQETVKISPIPYRSKKVRQSNSNSLFENVTSFLSTTPKQTVPSTSNPEYFAYIVYILNVVQLKIQDRVELEDEKILFPTKDVKREGENINNSLSEEDQEHIKTLVHDIMLHPKIGCKEFEGLLTLLLDLGAINALVVGDWTSDIFALKIDEKQKMLRLGAISARLKQQVADKLAKNKNLDPALVFMNAKSKVLFDISSMKSSTTKSTESLEKIMDVYKRERHDQFSTFISLFHLFVLKAATEEWNKRKFSSLVADLSFDVKITSEFERYCYKDIEGLISSLEVDYDLLTDFLDALEKKKLIDNRMKVYYLTNASEKIADCIKHDDKNGFIASVKEIWTKCPQRFYSYLRLLSDNGQKDNNKNNKALLDFLQKLVQGENELIKSGKLKSPEIFNGILSDDVLRATIINSLEHTYQLPIWSYIIKGDYPQHLDSLLKHINRHKQFNNILRIAIEVRKYEVVCSILKNEKCVLQDKHEKNNVTVFNYIMLLAQQKDTKNSLKLLEIFIKKFSPSMSLPYKLDLIALIYQDDILEDPAKNELVNVLLDKPITATIPELIVNKQHIISLLYKHGNDQKATEILTEAEFNILVFTDRKQNNVNQLLTENENQKIQDAILKREYGKITAWIIDENVSLIQILFAASKVLDIQTAMCAFLLAQIDKNDSNTIAQLVLRFAQDGNVPFLEALINQKLIKENIIGTDGFNPMHVAVENKKFNVVNLFCRNNLLFKTVEALPNNADQNLFQRVNGQVKRIVGANNQDSNYRDPFDYAKEKVLTEPNDEESINILALLAVEYQKFDLPLENDVLIKRCFETLLKKTQATDYAGEEQKIENYKALLPKFITTVMKNLILSSQSELGDRKEGYIRTLEFLLSPKCQSYFRQEEIAAISQLHFAIAKLLKGHSNSVKIMQQLLLQCPEIDFSTEKEMYKLPLDAKKLKDLIDKGDYCEIITRFANREIEDLKSFTIDVASAGKKEIFMFLMIQQCISNDLKKGHDDGVLWHNLALVSNIELFQELLQITPGGSNSVTSWDDVNGIQSFFSFLKSKAVKAFGRDDNFMSLIDFQGNTIFHLLIQKMMDNMDDSEYVTQCQNKLTLLLQKFGATFLLCEAVNRDGKTSFYLALEYAIKAGKYEFVNQLIDSAKGSKDSTKLFFSTEQKKEHSQPNILHLLATGPIDDPNFMNIFRKTCEILNAEEAIAHYGWMSSKHSDSAPLRIAVGNVLKILSQKSNKKLLNTATDFLISFYNGTSKLKDSDISSNDLAFFMNKLKENSMLHYSFCLARRNTENTYFQEWRGKMAYSSTSYIFVTIFSFTALYILDGQGVPIIPFELILPLSMLFFVAGSIMERKKEVLIDRYRSGSTESIKDSNSNCTLDNADIAGALAAGFSVGGMHIVLYQIWFPIMQRAGLDPMNLPMLNNLVTVCSVLILSMPLMALINYIERCVREERLNSAILADIPMDVTNIIDTKSTDVGVVKNYT